MSARALIRARADKNYLTYEYQPEHHHQRDSSNYYRSYDRNLYPDNLVLTDHLF